MRKLSVFNNVTIDGFFTDAKNEMNWAHRNDPEWNEFVAGNASHDGTLLFGRITYQMMAGFWPTEQAAQMMPEVAEGMNRMSKVVFSKTLQKADWQNTQLIKGDLAPEVKKLKAGTGSDMVILGSGTIVSQLAQEGLIDEYQLAVSTIALGQGRTLFEGLRKPLNLKLSKSRVFKNGNVLLNYVPA